MRKPPVGADSISARFAAARTPRGRIWNPPLRMVARPAANRENANPAIPQPPVGTMLASSRGTQRRRKVRGRDLRPKSRRCAAVGLRNAPAGGINPAPTNKFYVLDQPGRPRPRVRTNPCRGRFHIGPVCGGANAPRADMESAPTNGGKARGQPEKCEPGDTTTPCRGRCSHRPGDPAPPQGLREGHGPPLQPRQTPDHPAPRNLRGTPHIPPQPLNIFPSRPQGGGPPHLNSEL